MRSNQLTIDDVFEREFDFLNFRLPGKPRKFECEFLVSMKYQNFEMFENLLKFKKDVD